MSTINPELKKFADQFNLDYEALAKEAPQITELAEQVKDSKNPEKNEYVALPDGRYTGRVYIEVTQVKKTESPSFGKLMLKFSLKVSEGECAGRYDYLYFVVAPAHLTEPKPKQSKEDWDKAKADYWTSMMKTLQNCGVDTSATNELETFSKAAGVRGNTVQFTVKSNNGRRYVYIDRLIERATPKTEDATELFGLPDIPDGDDAPFGEGTNTNI
jgi:hypothetical protein